MADKCGLKGSVKRLIQHLYPEGLFELPTSIKLTSIYGKSFETLVQELR